MISASFYSREVNAFTYGEPPTHDPCPVGVRIKIEPNNELTPVDLYCLDGDALVVGRFWVATRRYRRLQTLAPADPGGPGSVHPLVVPALEGAIRIGASDDGSSVYVVNKTQSILLVFRRDTSSGLLTADESLSFATATERDEFFTKTTSKSQQVGRQSPP